MTENEKLKHELIIAKIDRLLEQGYTINTSYDGHIIDYTIDRLRVIETSKFGLRYFIEFNERRVFDYVLEKDDAKKVFEHIASKYESNKFSEKTSDKFYQDLMTLKSEIYLRD